MASHLRNGSVLKRVTPDEIIDFLIECGWMAGNSWRQVAVEFSKGESTVVVPLSVTVGDYAVRVSQIMDELSQTEPGSAEDIFDQLLMRAGKFASPDNMLTPCSFAELVAYMSNSQQQFLNARETILAQRGDYESFSNSVDS